MVSISRSDVERRRQMVFTAWGETKRGCEWQKDPRCKAHLSTIVRRIEKLGWSPESAIETPVSNLVEWLGERKSLRSWSRDERCWVRYETLVKRFNKGMTGDDLFQMPRKKNFDEVEIFGEVRSLLAWSRDARCAVSYNTLKTRREKGISGDALLAPSKREKNRSGGESGNADLFDFYGEKKTLKDWSEDPRCFVCIKTLKKRIARGIRDQHLLKKYMKVSRLLDDMRRLGVSNETLMKFFKVDDLDDLHKTRFGKGYELLLQIALFMLTDDSFDATSHNVLYSDSFILMIEQMKKDIDAHRQNQEGQED